MTNPADENSYDQVPYPNYSHRESHPRHLESIATLFGMSPPPITQSRVLELGCAAGWNLIPQAQDLPHSQFLGIDLSKRQIDDAQSMVKKLGLDNIELRCADILDIDESWGQFDYIICHGIFSWVPEIVRAKILEICCKNLAPDGVALVSYNVYPGWQFRSMIRDMMRYHIADRKEPRQQVTQARALLDFLASNSQQDTLYARVLQDELARISDNEDAQLFHDHLEDVNYPLYFHQFVEQAKDNDLQYLGDVQFSQMILSHLPGQARRALGEVPLIQQEQYMDFIRNRGFRLTLLCHADVKLERNLQPDILYAFHFAILRPLDLARLDLNDGRSLRINVGDNKIVSEEPVVKAAVYRLSEIWPVTIPFEELHAVALGMLSPQQRNLYQAGRTDSRLALASTLMEFLTLDLVGCFVNPPGYASSPGEYPVASPVARFQALAGNVVTNCKHERIKLNETERRIIASLDGNHDRGALLEDLKAAFASGAMTLHKDGKVIHEMDAEKLSRIIDTTLGSLNRLALLVA